jgi:hypothetical protein
MINETMSLRTDAMSPSSSSMHRPSLQIGVAVASSATVAAGLGFAIVYFLNRTILPSFLVLTSAMGLGLVAGLVSRFSLTDYSARVRWLVALFALCVGMVFLGWLSSGILGFNLIYGMENGPDWMGLGRFGLGALAAWLAVKAWAVRSSARVHRDRNLRSPRTWLRNVFAKRARRGEETAAAVITSSQAAAPNRQPTQRVASIGNRDSPRREGPRQDSAAALRPIPQLGVKLKSKLRRRIQPPQYSIRLAKEVEHRCPFCLGLVDPIDPKGVKECKVCNTLHHTDCWAVTGTCQVPHHHQ